MTAGVLTWLTDPRALMGLLAAHEVQGLLLVALVIFCETGLVLLPFLPGDSILFALGAFSALNHGSPLVALGVVVVAAVAGDGVNFLVGRSRVGRWLVGRKWISDANMRRTEDYFARYGGATVTIGRFVPIVRTIAPFVAGLTRMAPGRFLLFNVAGGVTWAAAMVLAGYWLGRVEWIGRHLSMLSLAVQWLRVRHGAQAPKRA